MTRLVLFGSLLVAGLGCTLTRGAHVVVGTQRPATQAEQVKLYLELPKKYERIALVSSDSRNAFASHQNLTDHAILRLKQEAAKVGANGILIEGIGNWNAGSVGVAGVTPGSPLVLGAGNSVVGKEAKGLAIYVIEE